MRRPSPGHRQPRLKGSAGYSCVPSMAPAPNPGPVATVAAAGLASVGSCRLLAVAAPHLAAIGLMLHTETDFGARMGFVVAWGLAELLLDRAAAASGAVGCAVADAGRGADAAAAQLKHAIVQMTANFIDLMVIDRDNCGVSVYDLSQSALVGDRRGRPDPSPDVRAVVARPVPHPPPAGAGVQADMPGGAGSDIPWRGRTRPGAAITTTAICRTSPAPA